MDTWPPTPLATEAHWHSHPCKLAAYSYFTPRGCASFAPAISVSSALLESSKLHSQSASGPRTPCSSTWAVSNLIFGDTVGDLCSAGSLCLSKTEFGYSFPKYCGQQWRI